MDPGRPSIDYVAAVQIESSVRHAVLQEERIRIFPDKSIVEPIGSIPGRGAPARQQEECNRDDQVSQRKALFLLHFNREATRARV